MQARHRHLGGLAALLLAACTSGPGTSPSPDSSLPTPTADASAAAGSPSPSPYVPPTFPPQPPPVAYVAGPAWEPFGDPITFDASRTSATTQAHGIRISVTPDATTFTPADGLWVTTTLENLGSKVLHWITDGCGTNVSVDAHQARAWTYGAEQPPPFGRFKEWMLERYDLDDRYPIYLDTVPDWGVDKGEFGCADLGMGHDLKPGRKLVARMFVRVNYWLDHWYGRPPSGPVLLTGTFGTWYRGDEDMDTVHHDALVASLVVELQDGRESDWISPGQAVDVALGDPQLQAQILEWPEIPNFVPTTIVLDEARGEWIVGAGFERASTARPMTIRVDAREARIVSVANEAAPTHQP